MFSSDSDFAAHLLSLNIGGKFCFSLPEDLTVKDYFCIFMIVPCLDFCWEIQDTRAKSCACARHQRAPLISVYVLNYSFGFFFIRCCRWMA